MRRILASTLMLSSILFPAVAKAGTSPDDAAATTPALRVSTGVIAPSLAEAIAIQIPDGLPKSFVPAGAEVGLSFTVDSNGQAQNVKVVKSFNPFWDARVVEAIEHSRFHPGKLDKQTIPVDMNITVAIAQ